MNNRWTILAAAAICFAMTSSTLAQYPIAPHDQVEAYNAALADQEKVAHDRFEKAKIEMAKEGKPYIPWAGHPGDLPQAGIKAFPGAQGGGAWSAGGRGGKIYVVTSLEDDGPGTLREACEAGGARIVVFNVSGIIHLKSRLHVYAPYITIEGQSAPGDGICIAGATTMVDTHDVIVRYMRFRRGETNVLDRDDSFGGNPIGNVMVDHVSGSWGLDENMSMYRHMYHPPDQKEGEKDWKESTVNITFQHCIFEEGLNTYHHAFGSTLGGYNSMLYRNLWACNSGRNPSVGMNGDFNFVNNVLFNWQHRSVDGGDDITYFNIINNYYKPGPATNDGPVHHRILKPEMHRGKNAQGKQTVAFGKAYVAGNVMEGNDAVTKDNWADGVQINDGDLSGDVIDPAVYLPKIRVDTPFPMAKVDIISAQDAYEDVLAHSGATLPVRDAVDTRVVNEVRTGKIPEMKIDPDIVKQLTKNKFTDERGQELAATISKGIITNPSQVGGYPDYKGTPFVDKNHNGVPDDWEKAHGWDVNDSSFATKDSGNGYMNIEVYLNTLAGDE